MILSATWRTTGIGLLFCGAVTAISLIIQSGADPEVPLTPERILGTWIYDPDRAARLDAALIDTDLGWRKVVLRITAESLTMDGGAGQRQGTCTIHGYPPGLYRIIWQPDDSTHTVELLFDAYADDLDMRSQTETMHIIPLRRQSQTTAGE